LNRRISAKTSARRGGVEVAGGLVGEDERRPVGERPRDRHALLLAAREVASAVVHAVGQADGAEDVLAPGAHGAAGRTAVAPRGEHRVLERREPERRWWNVEDEAEHAGAHRGCAALVEARGVVAAGHDASADRAGR
jgi:hypothetical protein